MFKRKIANVVPYGVVLGLSVVGIGIFNHHNKKSPQHTRLLTDLKAVIPSEQLNERPDILDRYDGGDYNYQCIKPYTAAHKRRDIMCLEKISASDYSKELINFQDALFHVSVQSPDIPHDNLCKYMTLPLSRGPRMAVLIQQGYFDLCYNLMKRSAKMNWLTTVYSKERMPLILHTIQAGEKELVSYLLQLEWRCVNSSNSDALKALIANLKELNLMSEEDATNISARISDKHVNSEEKDMANAADMFKAINWNELSAVDSKNFSNSR